MVFYKVSANGGVIFNTKGKIVKRYQKQDYKNSESLRKKVLTDWSKMVDNIMENN